MKKIIYFLMILPLMAILGGCSDNEEIIFDHEMPQFEIKDNAILLEVIMPVGSLVDDDYYITGDFNGGEEAIGNPEWQLEKSPTSNLKWGIYLLPSTFQNGKTLEDGFTFHTRQRGGERSVFGEEVTHTLNVGIGTRTNVWVAAWERTGEEERDWVRIYVDDQSGWEGLALHYWGDGITGTEWPGLQVVGTETIGGIEYKYFDLPKDLKGQTINSIFNNNGAGAQFDAMMGLKVESDVYVKITDNSFEIIDPNNIYKGYTVYVEDNSGWAETFIYGWDGNGDVTPTWPGLTSLGTQVINDVTYKYFRWGEELNGRTVNMIFTNNDGSQFDGIPEFVIDHDLYLRITDSGYEEVD